MKPWNRRHGDACVLVSSQAGVVPRVKLQKSLYLSESRFDGEERVRKQWVGGEIGGEEGKQRV